MDEAAMKAESLLARVRLAEEKVAAVEERLTSLSAKLEDFSAPPAANFGTWSKEKPNRPGAWAVRYAGRLGPTEFILLRVDAVINGDPFQLAVRRGTQGYILSLCDFSRDDAEYAGPFDLAI